jgi:glycosyltransferase involved in cell wall biosynthesis
LSVLIFAPPPPPPGGLPGGIAAITAVLMGELGEARDISFAAPLRKEDSDRFGLWRGLVNIARLARATRRVERRGAVLLFSSAGFSFWEKCAWSLIVRAMGRGVAIVMVDGNFPRWFAALPASLRRIARAVCRGRRFVLGAQSPRWQTYFRESFPGARVERVTASAHPDFFAQPASRVPHADGVRVLYVGWIIEAKGVLDLLDGGALLMSRTTRPFHIRLVGPVLEDVARWQDEIDRRGLHDVAALTGSVNDRGELLNEFHSADIFVFPSHFEGFPVALVEAAAVGLPCIGARVGGVPDILADGQAGIIVPARDPAALADALHRMLENDEERIALGDALRRHARAEYTPEACGQSYRELLATVGEGPRPRLLASNE